LTYYFQSFGKTAFTCLKTWLTYGGVVTDYIETKTSDGTIIRIEVQSTTKTATGFGGRLPAPTNLSNETAATAYDQTLLAIRACADGVIKTLQNLEATPSAASIDFAIKIDADAGAMVAKSRDDAQFKVSLTWKQVEADEKEE
jgi:hypothetical protein